MPDWLLLAGQTEPKALLDPEHQPGRAADGVESRCRYAGPGKPGHYPPSAHRY